MTATANRRIVTRGAKAQESALDMTYHGQTFYNAGTIERALRDRVPVRIANDKLVAPHLVHRQDLLGVLGNLHEDAGAGKYVDQDAIVRDKTKTTVTGANNVNPFLREQGSYNSIIAALQKITGINRLRELTAVVKTSRANGEYLEWQGTRNEADAVVVSDWVSAERIWEVAQEMNPKLVSNLRSNKSQRDDVSEHKSARDKFMNNLDVLRRAREVFHAINGETAVSGGATPYAMPLEQCGFAIDFAYLTTGVDENGIEVVEPFYRFAVGRSKPWVVLYHEWRGAGNNKLAYLNETVRNKVMNSKKSD